MEKFNELRDVVSAAAAAAADRQSNGAADVNTAKPDHTQQQTVCLAISVWFVSK